MDVTKKGSDLLRRGFVLTKFHCPKCNSPLFKDPSGKELICIKCEYKISLDCFYIEMKYSELLETLKKEKDPKNLYLILKALKLVKEFLKNCK